MIRTRAVAAAVGTAALVFALSGASAAHAPGASAAHSTGVLETTTASQREAPEPAPDILLPEGDPLVPAESDVRAQVAPGEVAEIGVASSNGPAGLTISTVTAVGPDEALALVDELAAEPDTLAVGLPQPIYTQGTSAAAAPLPAAVTTPAAVDPYRPEDVVFPFPLNQYAPDMLCTDLIAEDSSRYTCSASAWQYSTGAGQVVAVLDQGVDTSHPDLAAAIVPGASCFADGCTAVVQTAPDQRADHGTHVAGVIAATTNNGIGVAGMSPGARIMPVQVLPPDTSVCDDDPLLCSTLRLARGIDWAVDNGADVINMSLGTMGGPSDPVLEVTVAHAHYLQVALVAAAGNWGPDSNWISYPAAYPDVVGVGNVDSAKEIASSSSLGSWVDVVAPGTGVLSTLHTSGSGGPYGWSSGTSMATPHVAAAMALLGAQRPTSAPAELANLLYSTAEDLGVAGWDNTYGHGLIRPVAALQEPNGGVRAGRSRVDLLPHRTCPRARHPHRSGRSDRLPRGPRGLRRRGYGHARSDRAGRGGGHRLQPHHPDPQW